MKTSNKKRILSFVMALALLVTGVWNNGKFVSRAADNEITLSWSHYDGDFVLGSTVADAEQSYYIFDSIYFDGVEINNNIVGQMTAASKVVIWSWSLTNPPTKSIEIKAGTILHQSDASNPWVKKEGGKTYTVTQALHLTSADGTTWELYQETPEVPETPTVAQNIKLTYNSRWPGNDGKYAWEFDVTDLPSETVKYYRLENMTVDGTEQTNKVWVEINKDTKKAFIYASNWDAGEPTSSLLIPAGAILREANQENPWGSNPSGATLKVTNNVYVTTSDGGTTWAATPYEEPVSDKDVALRFVVASDMHIADTNSNDNRVKYFKQMFETAYKYAEKDTNHATIDAFVMVGDIVNTGEGTEYTSLKELIESANTKSTPILTVTGNHEWWGDKSADKVAEKKQNYLNGMEAIDSVTTKTMNWSTEINGYTFIGMSQESNDTFSTDTLNWMSGQVESAIAQDPTKPVFTLQHLAPNNTVYGSKTNAGWDANGVLNSVYEGHQQVINFSGHSHAPINTPTAINQTSYTQYTTGTLYYMELDGSASYGAQPAGTSPTAEYTIVEVYGDNTVKMFPYDELDNKDTFFKKLDGSGEQLIYEIDVNDKANWKYTSARKTNNSAPAFAENAAITVSKETYKSATITFPQASDDTGVYAYDITCTPSGGGTEKNYRIFSEWYFSDMKSELSYTIPGLEAGKTYTVSVVPVDFFDAKGTAITATITTEAQAEAFSFSLGASTSDHFDLVPSNWDHVLGTYYKVPVTIDGTTEAHIVASHRAGIGLTVWIPSYMKVYGDVSKNSSIEIKAGAVLEEITMTTGYPVLENGDSITVSEDLKLLKGTDERYTEVAPNGKITFSFSGAYPQTGGYYQFVTNTNLSGNEYLWDYLTADILVDGITTKTTWVVSTNNQMYTLNYDDTMIQTSATSVVIPKGTVFTSKAGKPALETETDFAVVKINDTWTECYNTTLSLKAAGTTQVQLFSSCDALTTYGWEGRALKSTALVDDVATEVTWTIDTGMIWTAASNLISDSTQKIVIPAGTLLTPTAGNNKRPLYVSEDLILVKLSDNNWYDEKSIIDVTYNKFENYLADDNVLQLTLTSPWTADAGSYSGTIWIDGVETTTDTFWMNKGSAWFSNGDKLKPSIAEHKTIKIAKGTIFTCSGKAPMRLNAEKDLVFKWDGTTYVEGIKEETVEGKFSQVQSEKVQFCSTANFGSEIGTWETVKNAITIKVNGVETTADVCYGAYKEDNTESYFWLQGSAVKDAITKGATITLPTSATVYFANEKVTFNFAENMAIVKLGQGGAMYTSEYTYPNGDNKFYYNIDNGTSYKLTSSNNAILVKELPNLTTGDTIDQVGAYNITRIENEVLYKQVVVLYKHGDVNEDNTISAVDLIAMKKVAADANAQPARLAGTYAADINRDGKVNDDDLTALRKALVNAAELKVAKGNSVLNGVMPIVGYGVYDLEGKTTDDLYSLVSELGINAVSFNNKDYSSPSLTAGTLAHLQSAEKNGIGVYVQDNHLHQGSGFSTTADLDTMITEMSKRVGAYSMYKSFLGTYVVDEPVTTGYYQVDAKEEDKTKKNMSNYAHDVAMMKDFTNLNTYVNLLPYYSSEKSLAATENKYNAYLQETYKEPLKATYDGKFNDYGLDVLSFDNYPIGKGKTWWGGSTKEVGYSDFYTNLRLARAAAQEKGTPFWAFAQSGLYATNNSTISSDYLPTKADQQWEISASLACGAKGVQYFSVVGTSEWTASGKDTDRAGLIKADGTKNNKYGYYDAAKETNTFVAAVDHVLMNADNKGVITNDTNAQAPLTGMLLTNYNEVTSVAGANALVGCFDYYGKTALLVVNCNTSSSQEITLNFNGNQKFEVTNYAGVTTASEGTTFKSTIGAGQCSLVVLQ